MLLIEQFLLLIFFLLFLFYLYIKVTGPSRSTFPARLFEDIELTTSEHIANIKSSSPSISQGDIPKIYSGSKMNDERIFSHSHPDSTRGNKNCEQSDINTNMQSFENKQKDYRGEMQKSKRLYEKFFLKGTDTPNKKTQSKIDPYSTTEKKRGDGDSGSESHKSIISRNALSRSLTGQSDAFDAASKSDTSDVLNTAYIQSDQEDSKDSETGFKKKFDLFIKKLSQSSNDSDLLKKVMVSNSSSSDSVGAKNDSKDSQERPGKSGVLYPISQLNDEDEDEEQDKYKNDSFGFAKRKIDFSYELERFHKYSSSNSKGSSSSGK